MDAHTDWQREISEKIRGLKAVLSEREYKKRKLNNILRMIKRVADFSPTCEECHKFQTDITNLIHEMGSMAPATDKSKKSYRVRIKNITTHLIKKHKLSYTGQHIGLGLSIGIGIGVSIGSAMDNIAVGIGAGVGIGMAIGSALEANARKKGKVI
jgi:hypothetical protein